MDERVMQFRVGLMVFAAILVTVILVMLFGEVSGTPYGTYTIHIHFPQAPGVTPDTPVRKSGVLIGRVSAVDLLDQGGVMVTAKVDRRRRLFANENCRVTSTLLGDASLQFFLAGKVPGPPIEEGAQVTGEAGPDPIQAFTELQGNVRTALASVSDTSGDIRGVAQQLNGILQKNDDRITSILTRMDDAMAALHDTLANTNEVMGSHETRQRLRQSLDQFPELVSETRSAINRMQDTFKRVDENLDNVNAFTRPLAERGPRILNRLDNTMENVDEVVGQLVKFSQQINNPDGTVGQLLNKPDLYDNLNRAAVRVEELSHELRPILNDARVFTDKIARHPETLGVRGALERRPGIK